LNCGGADILEYLAHQLASHCGAFHVFVRSNLLGYPIGFLRIDDAVGILLRPQVPFEAEDKDWENVIVRICRPDLLEPLRDANFGC